MQIKSSTALRKDYGAISSLAHETMEPIYITMNGEGDTVLLSIDAYEAREKALALRASVLEAELDRLSGAPTYTVDEVRERLQEKYARG